MHKQTVHNLMEVKALIKEAFSHGNEMSYNHSTWFSHNYEWLCKSFIRDTEFELVVSNVDTLGGYRSVICEVY